ncbi:MAG: biotin--[acetyl-CoA-carboxylase] ligase [Gammaproteobacteria bacterium]|nr:biotin--[acetyl-CoA-carboxylase] ligase [Gammaproteobacteria bacterium]
MTAIATLDADKIREACNATLRRNLAELEVFATIDSTNSYLMQQPGPAAGSIRVAVSNNQTAGRGRHGKTWQSPRGTGIALSASYTYPKKPHNVSALTLALGVAIASALQQLGAQDVQLKWPNDLVANDGKLGGILSEVHNVSAGAATIVAGVGINTQLNGTLDVGGEADWARRIVDLGSVCDEMPSPEVLVASLMGCMLDAFIEFEDAGLEAFLARWQQLDWLRGRQISLDAPSGQVSGVGAGIAPGGALLVDVPSDGIREFSSGSVVFAGELAR